MATYYSINHSPRRLADRRGIPQLQPLEPAYEAKLSIASRMSSENDICTPQSVTSSSSRYSTDGFNSSQMSTPATPTDYSPFRPSATDAFSPVTAPPSIQEEDEENQECNCDCGGYPEGSRIRGLGFDVDGISRQTSTMRLSERLHVATESNHSLNYEYATHYSPSDSRGQYPMPPTPPSHAGERPYEYTENRSPILRPQKSDELIIDPECFSSGPSSTPQSPASESSGRSRAATILNKVVPYKLRASLKRRMSSPNNARDQPPPVPAASTMPNYYNPGTPPDDIFDDFFRKHDDTLKSSKTEDSASVYSNGEMPLPPLLHPAATFGGDMMESRVVSPLQSPRYMTGPSFFGADVFPEMCNSPISSELVNSPLHPPTISPLMSPSLASTSQTSLNIPYNPSFSSHKKVPSIDPATPLAPRRPSAPVTPVTADSLADMIEEMNADLSAYDATRALMIESGWSSPQEIQNVTAQRDDKERIWKERIAESKKVLEVMRRTEVKNYAMSSVSSIHSIDSTMTNNGPTNDSKTLIPVTILPVSDTQSLRSIRSAERTLSR